MGSRFKLVGKRRGEVSDVDVPGLSSGQVMFLALIIGINLGAAGLFSLALMIWLSHQSFGIDLHLKHGISKSNNSRLGGFAISLFIVLSIILTHLGLTDLLSFQLPLDLRTVPTYLTPVLVFWILGFSDDLGIDFAPIARLLVMIVTGLVCFAIDPDLMPQKLITQMGLEFAYSDVLFICLSAIILVGFVNAGNISDGANGLFSGICFFFFVAAWSLQGEPLYFYLSLALLSFLLVNLLTGRILLGDLGAYTLSSIIVFASFDLYDAGLVSVTFLASALSYPCLELVRVMLYRIANGGSPLIADDSHLHNSLNKYLSEKFGGGIFSNSMTGAIVALISSFPAYVILSMGQSASFLPGALTFLVQVIVFLVAFRLLKLHKKVTN